MNDPASLLQIQGVTGLCVHSGADICWKRLPVSITTGQADALCAAVQGAFAAYAGAERKIHEACFTFSGTTVLVIARPPMAEQNAAEHFLTLLLESPAAASPAANAARAWLRENPEFKKPPPRPASPLMMQRKK